MPNREKVLNELLNSAFAALLWISEAPDREDGGTVHDLAQRARRECAHIERLDPDKAPA